MSDIFTNIEFEHQNNESYKCDKNEGKIRKSNELLIYFLGYT